MKNGCAAGGFKNLKIGLWGIVFLYASAVWAKPYCISAGTYAIESSQLNTVSRILHDVPYPSYRLYPDGIEILMGRFKTKSAALRLLPLAKSRYAAAHVSDCKGAKPFRGDVAQLFTLSRPAKADHTAAAKEKAKKRESFYRWHKVKKERQSAKVQQGTSPLATRDAFEIRHRSAAMIPVRLMRPNKRAYAATVRDNRTRSEGRDAPPLEAPVWWSGLYARTNVGYDTRAETSAYDVRIEWDLFKEGYFELKRNYENQKLNVLWMAWQRDRAKELTTLVQIEKRIKAWQDTVDMDRMLMKLGLHERLCRLIKSRMRHGFATREDAGDCRTKLDQIRNRLYLYAHKKLTRLPRDIWLMLNRIEYLKIMPLTHLQKRIDVDKRLMKRLRTVKSSDRWEAWSDRLRLNLYAGMRKLYRNQEQTLIGLDAKIPLFVDRQRQSLQNLKAHTTAMQMKLEITKQKAKIEDLYSDFLYRQATIKSLKRALIHIETALEDTGKILKSQVAAFTPLPFDKEFRLIDRYVETLRQIDRCRFTALKDLTRMAAMAAMHSPSGLVE